MQDFGAAAALAASQRARSHKPSQQKIAMPQVCMLFGSQTSKMNRLEEHRVKLLSAHDSEPW